ncbi:MAG: methyltransferase domain-containing protein [Calothrix sp. MO_167.B12]|nr:methyltransferase domain-containing protein [Calothrix sp. MO_167.B12]
MPTLKQKIGAGVIPKLPISRHVFNHVRLELNAWRIRTLHQLHPGTRAKVEQLRQQRNLLVNIGCGPFGVSDWVNLDLYPHPNVALVADTRRSLPLADGSCVGIHVEHFLEHLDPVDECPKFLQECRRCLQPEGVLRVIVPDAELYIKAYLEPGWETFNHIGCGGENPEKTFTCKMEALNHIFLQGWEHYGGYDAEHLELTLRQAGFTKVNRCSWRDGNFPVTPIDREQHRSYSLYFEASF